MSSDPQSLADRTLVVSGGSRGIGLAIALGAAKLGANVVLLAKTSEPHPKLPGTVHTAVADVEAAGGKGLAVVGDVRKEEDVQRAVDAAVEHFGGVDIVVNNASAIATEPTEQLSAKKFDLMMDINVRGTFLLTKAALPHLRTSANAHVMTLAPPLNMNPYWLGAHPSYTLSKYGMTLLSLGWAAEYADAGIGFSCLWPQTYIATSAVSNLAGGDALVQASRSPDIMADAAVAILTKPAAEANGQCFIDADVLTASGVTDLSRYGGGDDPMWDIFLDKT
ncbi:NAD(P)-dependent oxidoreductase [Mycobacterium sp. URHB0044]|jgi:citronellol/citronellal dehydrogenase|uniref:SDR family oxidoreductase n=1 Tax=Mycobacterium sp. URHB0044 TaxID=1380386 RepID=UPI00048ED04B|nr:NAD(P)-dependent oxidoreductase [Mycobacterium sp. URHB0044]